MKIISKTLGISRSTLYRVLENSDLIGFAETDNHNMVVLVGRYTLVMARGCRLAIYLVKMYIYHDHKLENVYVERIRSRARSLKT